MKSTSKRSTSILYLTSASSRAISCKVGDSRQGSWFENNWEPIRALLKIDRYRTQKCVLYLSTVRCSGKGDQYFMVDTLQKPKECSRAMSGKQSLTALSSEPISSSTLTTRM